MIQGSARITTRVIEMSIVDELPVEKILKPYFYIMGVIVPAQVSSSSYEGPVIRDEGKTVGGAMSLYTETELRFREFLESDPVDDANYENDIQTMYEIHIQDRWLRISVVRDFEFFSSNHPGKHFRYLLHEPAQL